MPASRREVLQGAALVAATGLLGCPSVACEPSAAGCALPVHPADQLPPEALPSPCEPTPADVEGPYWRADAPLRSDLNVFDEAGTSLRVEGRVFGAGCSVPLADATVDLWHCGPAGAYDTDSEAFEFRGHTRTDAEGRWAFVTLLPGRYSEAGVYRPAHLHFKVGAPGHADVTTQSYFEDDPWIDLDEYATHAMAQPLFDDGDGGLIVRFDVVLEPQR